MTKANINVNASAIDNFKTLYNQLMNENAEVQRQLETIKSESAGEVLDRAVIATIMYELQFQLTSASFIKKLINGKARVSANVDFDQIFKIMDVVNDDVKSAIKDKLVQGMSTCLHGSFIIRDDHKFTVNNDLAFVAKHINLYRVDDENDKLSNIMVYADIERRVALDDDEIAWM